MINEPLKCRVCGKQIGEYNSKVFCSLICAKKSKKEQQKEHQKKRKKKTNGIILSTFKEKTPKEKTISIRPSERISKIFSDDEYRSAVALLGSRIKATTPEMEKRFHEARRVVEFFRKKATKDS